MARRFGARDFKFDIDTGVGSFLPAEGKPVDIPEIQAAVKESGFVLLWLEAQVRGVLQGGMDPTGSSRPALRVEETDQLFWLTEGTTKEEREGYSRLREWVNGPSRHVVVRGRAHSHVGSPPGLTVRNFRLVQGGR